jgi:hypothetical protein
MAQLKPLNYTLRCIVKPEIIRFLSDGSVKSSGEICDYINGILKLETPLNPAYVRKIVNEIRTLAESPICSNSNGYYISYDKEEIFKTAKSLEERIESIRAASDGMRRMLHGHSTIHNF